MLTDLGASGNLNCANLLTETGINVEIWLLRQESVYSSALQISIFSSTIVAVLPPEKLAVQMTLHINLQLLIGVRVALTYMAYIAIHSLYSFLLSVQSIRKVQPADA